MDRFFSNTENLDFKDLVSKRNFYTKMGVFEKPKELNKEVSYKTNFGELGNLAVYNAKSKQPLVIIDDLILSKLNSCIFGRDWTKLFDFIKKLSDKGFKDTGFKDTGFKFVKDKNMFGCLASPNSKHSSIEISSFFTALRSVNDKDKIDNLDDLKTFLGLFDLQGFEDIDRKKFCHNFINIIKPNCFGSQEIDKAVSVFEKLFCGSFGKTHQAFEIELKERCEQKTSYNFISEKIGMASSFSSTHTPRISEKQNVDREQQG